MGVKLQEEMIELLKANAELLKANAIHLKCLVQEVQLLRRDMSKHSAIQQAGLKAWQDADTKHHLSDNGTLSETVKAMGAAIEKMNRFFEMFLNEKKIDR